MRMTRLLVALTFALIFFLSGEAVECSACFSGGTGEVRDGRVEFVRSGSANAWFSLSWTFADWEDETYVLLPACAYDGNRMFERTVQSYPPIFDARRISDCDYRPVTDIPKLEKDGTGKIEVTTGDLATPCAGFFFPRKKRGVLIYTEQGVCGRNAGYTVERGRLTVSYPSQRKDAYRFCREHERDPETGLDLADGARIGTSFAQETFDADDISAFLERYFRLRNRLVPAKRIAAPYNDLLVGLVENALNEVRWNERYGFYGEGNPPRWTPAWVHGMPLATAMLCSPTAVSRERAFRTVNHLVRTVSPIGAFLESNDAGLTGHLVDDTRISRDIGCDYQLVRRSAAGLYFLLRFMERAGESKPEWDAAAKKLADTFDRVWRTSGEWGMFWNSGTGAPVIHGTANAALAPAALMLASKRFGEKRYSDTAQIAATSFYEMFVAKGVSYGGPNEALMAPDSESAGHLVECLVTMAEETGDAIWVKRARDAAHLLSTWVMSYAYEFPPGSEFARIGINTTGSVFANAQNKHSAPGLCTNSAGALYRLYGLTHDRMYLDLCRDISAFIPQCVSTASRPIFTWGGEVLPPGWICERVNTSDWEGPKCEGGVFKAICWCATSMLCTTADLVGKSELDLGVVEWRKGR